MNGKDFLYCGVIIGTKKLTYNKLNYATKLYLCRRMSIDIMSMFFGSYVEFWMNYNMFGEDW